MFTLSLSIGIHKFLKRHVTYRHKHASWEFCLIRENQELSAVISFYNFICRLANFYSSKDKRDFVRLFRQFKTDSYNKFVFSVTQFRGYQGNGGLLFNNNGLLENSYAYNLLFLRLCVIWHQVRRLCQSDPCNQTCAWHLYAVIRILNIMKGNLWREGWGQLLWHGLGLKGLSRYRGNMVKKANFTKLGLWNFRSNFWGWYQCTFYFPQPWRNVE